MVANLVGLKLSVDNNGPNPFLFKFYYKYFVYLKFFIKFV